MISGPSSRWEVVAVNWYRHHWQYVGLVVAVGVAAYLAIAWRDLDIEQRVMLGSFILLLLHEAEEWAWPGGEPAVLNKVIPLSPMGKVFGRGATGENSDRYPANANSAMVVNVFAAYPIYILAAIFSDQIWLGLFVAFFFWVGQLIFHGVVTNIVLKSGYNPGLLTTVVAVALGIYYVWHVESSDLASGWDWLGAFLLLPVFVVVVMLKLTFTWLADENSPYRFTEAEMQKWDVDRKLARSR
jgi:Protein of unknown function with HXXEE motif